MSRYEQSIYNLIATGEDIPRLVFDIGANNGDDAAEYLKRGWKVVAVEANPSLCADLRARFLRTAPSGGKHRSCVYRLRRRGAKAGARPPILRRM